MKEEWLTILKQIRVESDPIKKAKLLFFLNVDNQIRIKDLARMLPMHPSLICHNLRLLKLPEIVVDGYYSKNISLSHLYSLSRLKDESAVVALYEKILSESLTVAQTEEAIREIIFQVKTEGERIAKEDIIRFQESVKKIDESINVKVVQTRIRSRVEFVSKGNLFKTSLAIKKLMNKLNN